MPFQKGHQPSKSAAEKGAKAGNRASKNSQTVKNPAQHSLEREAQRISDRNKRDRTS